MNARSEIEHLRRRCERAEAERDSLAVRLRALGFNVSEILAYDALWTENHVERILRGEHIERRVEH